MYALNDAAKTWREAFVEKARVIQALMLRDLRTRFFNHGFGFLVVIIMPLMHMAFIVVIQFFIGRTAPYGNSIILFTATGVVSPIVVMYIARFMVISLLMNRPLLSYPPVTMGDVLIARSILEGLAACCGVALIIFVLTLLGEDAMPQDPFKALTAFGAIVYLALGMGILNGLIAMIYPGWATAFTFSLILYYIMSGALFVPDQLPEQLQSIVYWNPVLHGTEWLRQAYFPSYGRFVFDKTYMLSFASLSLVAGLIMERYARRPLLDAR